MTATDSQFAGSIPQLYDRHLGPLLFRPYAREVARRVAALHPRRILEIAAGTGIVTQELATAVPDAELVATDLNQAMLDVASARIDSPKVSFRTADALGLPFADGEFDAAVVQFGIMFYPDKVKGNAEARRVLRDGGTYIAVIWDSLQRNPIPRIAQDSVAALYPDNPSTFLERAPHGYADRAAIRRDMEAAGFGQVEIETVALKSDAISARDAATGLVAGSPMSAEVLDRDSRGLDAAIDAVAHNLSALERDGRLDADLSAVVVTATK